MGGTFRPADAVARVRPAGVDANSGVEDAPGHIREFVARAVAGLRWVHAGVDGPVHD
jgi:hypothetical protein